MEPMVLSILIGFMAYIILIALIPKRFLSKTGDYTQQMLDQLASATASVYEANEGKRSLLREQIEHASFLTRAFLLMPGAKRLYPRLAKAGLTQHIDGFFVGMFALLCLLSFLLRNMGVYSVFVAAAFTFLIGRWYINRRISKRNDAFIELFPDALDMIVRSLRSGYPLNASIRMIADNMQATIAEEFKQVADETAYGSTLAEALGRLSQRIDEPDIRFFVVVLAVQQEVGGNLSEVLGNLSSIIRKRKHLRLKIRAMTSEGMAAAWVLGMLPVFEFVIITIFAPTHLTPFFTTHIGNMMLGSAVAMVVIGIVIVRKMIHIEV
jgi:tight adherence protein B